jgi:hypothetical protein
MKTPSEAPVTIPVEVPAIAPGGTEEPTFPITFEMVEEAYRRTRLQPLSRCWLEYGVYGTHACPMTALTIASQAARIEDIADELRRLCGGGIVHIISAALNLHPEFVRGFAYGFDGGEAIPNVADPEFHRGEANGRAIAAELRQKRGFLL